MTTVRPLIHFASIDVTVNDRLRQRCAWCGHVLLDYDLTRTASPCGDACKTDGCQPEHHRMATWSPGALVLVDGGMTALVNHQDGDPLPDGTCHDAEKRKQANVFVLHGPNAGAW
jgi:hypothetical protein